MLVPAPATDTPDMGHGPGGIGKLLIVADKDSTLPCVQVLAGLKTEGADGADGANLAAFPLGGMGLGRVLDDLEIVISGDGENGVHIGGAACDMDRDDGAR